MKETKATIMEGIEATKSKLVANNTVEYERPDGTRVIRLHHTDILEFAKDGTLTINTHGWKTVTTKSRINEFQGQVVVTQDKGIWYITKRSDPWNKEYWIPYFDGIRIKDGKFLNAKTNAHKKEQFWIKKINDYCQKLKAMEKLPEPSNGDCWYCLFHSKDGRSMGDMAHDIDHIKEHIKTKYIHGAIIFNALQWAGYPNPTVPFQMDVRTSIVSAMRRYLKSQLRLAS